MTSLSSPHRAAPPTPSPAEVEALATSLRREVRGEVRFRGSLEPVLRPARSRGPAPGAP